MIRILVTGTQGQLVRAMQERVPAGVALITLGRPQLDLAELRAIREVLAKVSADVVVNAAAYTQVDKAETEEDLALRINAEAAGQIARAAYEQGAGMIQLSTDYVFDGLSPRPYREEDVTNPLSAYGRTKLAGEQAVLAAHPHSLIVRTAWVYSPFGTNFVKTMLNMRQSEIRVVADQHGCPTNALDLADAIFAIAPQKVGGVFHITGAGETHWADLARAIFAAAGRNTQVIPIRTDEYPRPAPRPANSRLDNRRLAQVFGLRLPDWRESLGKVVARLEG